MIYGIGIDIVEINKVQKIVICSGDKLANRVLSTSELQVYYKKKHPIRFLAKRFAGKEAVMKAFGTGVAQGVTFNQFEIFNDDAGKPVLRLFSQALLLAKKLSIRRTHITLSDTDLYACAVAVFEKV